MVVQLRQYCQAPCERYRSYSDFPTGERGDKAFKENYAVISSTEFAGHLVSTAELFRGTATISQKVSTAYRSA